MILTSKTKRTCLETHPSWNVQLSCGNRRGNQVEGLVVFGFFRGLVRVDTLVFFSRVCSFFQ